MDKYTLVLDQLRVLNKLLMATVVDLDKVRNKKERTKHDEQMLKWILSIRRPIEEERDKLENCRRYLWDAMQH